MSVVTDTTNHSNRLSAAERRALRAEAPGSKAAADLVASGALDGLFARIDAGEIASTLGQNLGPINAANLKKAHAFVEGGAARGKGVLEGFGA